MARLGGFTAPPFPNARTFDGDHTFDILPGRPQALTVSGHAPGSTTYVFPGHDAVFTGGALVTHDGITGHHGPRTVCRAFTADSTTTLASLDRLATLPQQLVLPGHGAPFTQGFAAATRETLTRGVA